MTSFHHFLVYDNYTNNAFRTHQRNNINSFKKVQCLRYPLGENYRGVAGGLYISSIDLAKIMSMLMNKGVYNGIRLYKEETILEIINQISYI